MCPRKMVEEIWETSSRLLQYFLRSGYMFKESYYVLCIMFVPLHALSHLFHSTLQSRSYYPQFIFFLFSDNDSNSNYHLLNNYYEARMLILYIR